MKIQMQELKIFLSSSFRDMHAERDYLLTHIFPRLELLLRRTGHRLNIVDLRGTAQDCEAEAFEREVFRMCLDEVDRCKPRMLGLVGFRYGWIPFIEGESDEMMALMAKKLAREHGLTLQEVSGKSITHLEILYGLRVMDIDKCFFFFRVIQPLPGTTEEDMRLFVSDEDGMKKVMQLSGHLMHTYGVKNIAPPEEPGHHLQFYSAELVGKQVTGLETFGNLVYHNLFASFFDELQPRGWPDWQIRLMNYWDDKALHTIPHPQLSALCAHNGGVAAVTGPEGIGKTVLLAQALFRLQESCTVLSFVAGIEEDTDTFDGMIRFLIRAACAEVGRESDAVLNGGRGTLLALLEVLAKRNPVVLVLDGLEKLQDSELAESFVFTALPVPQVRIICAAADSFYRTHTPGFVLGAPAPPEALVDVSALRRGKKMDPEIRALVLEAAEETQYNPLFIDLLLSRLLSMRQDDYERFSSENAHLEWMREVIEGMRRTLKGSARLTVDLVSRDVTGSLVYTLLRSIQESDGGLSEDAVLDVLIESGEWERPAPAKNIFDRKAKRAAEAYEIETRRMLLELYGMLRPILLFDVTARHWALGHAFLATMKF